MGHREGTAGGRRPRRGPTRPRRLTTNRRLRPVPARRLRPLSLLSPSGRRILSPLPFPAHPHIPEAHSASLTSRGSPAAFGPPDRPLSARLRCSPLSPPAPPYLAHCQARPFEVPIRRAGGHGGAGPQDDRQHAEPAAGLPRLQHATESVRGNAAEGEPGRQRTGPDLPGSRPQESPTRASPAEPVGPAVPAPATDIGVREPSTACGWPRKVRWQTCSPGWTRPAAGRWHRCSGRSGVSSRRTSTHCSVRCPRPIARRSTGSRRASMRPAAGQGGVADHHHAAAVDLPYHRAGGAGCGWQRDRAADPRRAGRA